MSKLRVACQTYTWEMHGDAWRGQVTDLLDWVSAAGYAGIEITNTMIGEFASRPDDFAFELQARGLQLACFAYASTSGFTDPARLEADLEGGRRAIAFLSHFPHAKLGFGGAASPDRSEAKAKLDRAIGLYNQLGREASAAGLSANVHPHSHFGSLLESAEEYRYLLDHLEPDSASFGPDTGHIIRGGQDLLTCLRTHLPRITHLHLKDVDAQRRWQPLGEGVIDFPAVLRLLDESGYAGWVVAEEESEQARQDGVGAVERNRAYLRQLGY
jgi:inosose dehydratase